MIICYTLRVEINEVMKMDTRSLIDKLSGELKHPYAYAVHGVNKNLMGIGAPIGNKMRQVVNNNLREIKNGSKNAAPIYHLSEVPALTMDGIAALKKREFYNAGLNFAGAAANSVAFLISGASEHQSRYRRQG
jgi:hypothetical protein